MMNALKLVAAATVVLVACTNSNKMQSSANNKSKQKVLLEGHRGCRGLMPENTIPAFTKAMEMGVPVLELDVVITKDSQVVVSHDTYFNHEITTLPAGSGSTFIKKEEQQKYNIYQMPYSEVRRFDVGLKPHSGFPEQQKVAAYKPLLSEVFASAKAWAAANKKPLAFFNVEIKSNPATDNIAHPATARFVELVMAEINKAGMQKQVIVQSFDFRNVQCLHQHYPAIQTAILIGGSDKRSLTEHIATLGFTPTTYSPAYELVTPELVAACKQNKLTLVPWTVNDTAAMKRLIDMGVDGIITDYPDRFYAVTKK